MENALMLGKAGILTEQPPAPKATNNRLLAAMLGDPAAQIEPDLKLTILPQGAVCYGAGDPIDQVYFPIGGMISCLVVTGEGEMVETSTVGQEGAAGIQCGLGHRYSYTRCIVQISGKFTVLPASRLEAAVARSPGLRDLIFRYIETLWAEAQQNAACNAIHDGSARLARWLLQCSDRVGSEQLALTQEFLAEMLGVRRTTVTLLAQELQKQGLVRYSRGRITILDRPALHARACECYDALKHDTIAHRIGART